MELTIATIILILIISVFLVITEIFLIPGTTIFGILGGVALALGIYFAFNRVGDSFGYGAIAATGALFVVFFLLGRRMTKSETFSLADKIEGKVNVLDTEIVSVGDRGVTVSTLKPNGKVVIEDKKLEVYSVGPFIDEDQEIEVTKVTSNKIYVKPLKT